MAKVERVRAVAGHDTTTGMRRYRLYKAAFERIKQAMRDGYFLEAITLCESLLSDRLESRATFLTKKNQGFKTVGALARLTLNVETLADFKDVLKSIEAWAKLRNAAMHELVKFEEHDARTWEEKIATLEAVAKERKLLLQRFDKLDKAARREAGVRRAATEPAAFR